MIVEDDILLTGNLPHSANSNVDAGDVVLLQVLLHGRDAGLNQLLDVCGAFLGCADPLAHHQLRLIPCTCRYISFFFFI